MIRVTGFLGYLTAGVLLFIAGACGVLFEKARRREKDGLRFERELKKKVKSYPTFPHEDRRLALQAILKEETHEPDSGVRIVKVDSK